MLEAADIHCEFVKMRHEGLEGFIAWLCVAVLDFQNQRVCVCHQVFMEGVQFADDFRLKMRVARCLQKPERKGIRLLRGFIGHPVLRIKDIDEQRIEPCDVVVQNRQKCLPSALVCIYLRHVIRPFNPADTSRT